MPRDPMAKKQRTSLADVVRTSKSNRDSKTLDAIKEDVQGKKSPTKRLNTDVPVDLYNQFGAKARLKGLSITKAVNQLVQRVVNEDIELFE